LLNKHGQVDETGQSVEPVAKFNQSQNHFEKIDNSVLCRHSLIGLLIERFLALVDMDDFLYD
jgi:hypothetical protein